jgi:vWA-MoxR associated protein C-terminal domain/vWA-MoxR associated protein middle region 0/Effector-associated domain 2
LTSGSQGVPLRIQRDLVDALERCEALRGEGGRQMLVDLLADVIRGVVSLHAHFTPRGQLVDVVRRCCAVPGGLHTLAQAAEMLDPWGSAVSTLRHLADEWEAVGALPIDDWNALRTALLSVRLASEEANERKRLRALVRSCTEGRIDELPSHCRSVWSTFLHLAGQNTAPRSLPPAMIFLVRIADEVGDSPPGAELRKWIRRWSEALESAELLQEATWRPVEINMSGDVHLVIQFDPDPTDRDRFVVTHWRHWGARGWHAPRRGDTPVGRTDLESEVDRLISDLEVDLGNTPEALDGQIFLAFIVPWEMLNVPVEYWRKASMSQDAVPLAVDHPVVLSSLDRMRAARHRLAWKQRWRTLARQPEGNRAYWSRPSGSEYFTRLAAELNADNRIVSLVLSEPPADRKSTAWREVAMAFRAGIPAIMWDREDCTAESFRAAITTVHAEGAVAELPRRIAALRREALRSGGHAGLTLAVLWDDPDRLPDAGSW